MDHRKGRNFFNHLINSQLLHKDPVFYSKLLIYGCWFWGLHRLKDIGETQESQSLFLLLMCLYVGRHFHFWMCMSLCNWCSNHIRKPLQYRKPRLKSDNTKRMIIVEEEVVVVMIVVLCEVFLRCVVLALPSFHWLSFLTFPLSLPQRKLQFRVGTRTVAKFVFGLVVLNSLSVGTYWVSVPTLVCDSCVLYPLFPEHHVGFIIMFVLPVFLFMSLSWNLDCCLKVISILWWGHILLLYHRNILRFIFF